MLILPFLLECFLNPTSLCWKGEIEKGQKKCTLLEVRFKQKRKVLQVLHFKCPSGRHGFAKEVLDFMPAIYVRHRSEQIEVTKARSPAS